MLHDVTIAQWAPCRQASAWRDVARQRRRHIYSNINEVCACRIPCADLSFNQKEQQLSRSISFNAVAQQTAKPERQNACESGAPERDGRRSAFRPLHGINCAPALAAFAPLSMSLARADLRPA